MEDIDGNIKRHADLGELIGVWASYRELLEMPRDPDVTEEDAQVRAGQYLEASLAAITYSDIELRIANGMVFGE